jgi:K+-sensing histidine kinase KdpD
MSYRVRVWIGIAVCVLAAALVTPLFRHSSQSVILPFLFLAVIIPVALRFGSIAGIAGTLLAGLIFAAFLFPPTISLVVEHRMARSNLIWMFFIGVISSELLGSYVSPMPGKDSPSERDKGQRDES